MIEASNGGKQKDKKLLVTVLPSPPVCVWIYTLSLSVPWHHYCAPMTVNESTQATVANGKRESAHNSITEGVSGPKSYVWVIIRLGNHTFGSVNLCKAFKHYCLATLDNATHAIFLIIRVSLLAHMGFAPCL